MAKKKLKEIIRNINYSSLLESCISLLLLIGFIAFAIYVVKRSPFKTLPNVLLAGILLIGVTIIISLLVVAIMSIYDKIKLKNIHRKMRPLSKYEKYELKEKQKRLLEIVKYENVLLIITKQQLLRWLMNTFYIVCAIALLFLYTLLSAHC